MITGVAAHVESGAAAGKSCCRVEGIFSFAAAELFGSVWVCPIDSLLRNPESRAAQTTHTHTRTL